MKTDGLLNIKTDDILVFDNLNEKIKNINKYFYNNPDDEKTIKKW